MITATWVGPTPAFSVRGLVLDLCERTIVLHDGRVTADGPTREIFADEALLAESRLEKPLRMQGCPVCGR